MKENSIEEDISVLKNCWVMTTEHELDKNNMALKAAIKNIVKDYKRVLKENEELKIIKSAIQTLQINSIEDEKYIVISKSSFLDGSYKHLLDDYIPVQKVKAKIEELKQEKKKYGNCLIEMYEDELVNRDIKILQELLESEE